MEIEPVSSNERFLRVYERVSDRVDSRYAPVPVNWLPVALGIYLTDTHRYSMPIL